MRVSHFLIDISSSLNRQKEIFPAQYVKRVTNIWPDNSPWRAVGDFCGLEKEVFILTPVSAVPNFTHSLLKERENNEHESDDDDCVAKVLSS